MVSKSRRKVYYSHSSNENYLRMKPKRFLKISKLVILVFLILMPFFWLKPGEMDLGGDGGRLYFHDPRNLIKNLGSFYLLPFGKGTAEAKFYYLPFFSLLVFLKSFLISGRILISIHNAFKLVIGFLSVYLIVKELIVKKSAEAGAILAGLFYVFNRGMIANYTTALPSHDQVFLNPLMFYLILKYILSKNSRYLWFGLLVSLIFSHSFSYSAAPPFFAFYPLSFLFLLIYVIFIRHEKIPWKGLLIGFLIFLGLHLFHLIPELADLFTLGSNTNTRVFKRENIAQQVTYFFGVLPLVKLSTTFF